MHKHHSSHRTINGKNFIILPIIFCVVILGMCTAVVYPSYYGLLSFSSLFFSGSGYSSNGNYDNIFVPVAEDEDEYDPDKPQTQKTVPISSIQYPMYGDLFGELIIDDCQIKNQLFFGDGDVQLNNGVGVYSGSFIPGYGKTIIVAGHNNTYFNGLKYAKAGQKVKIRTSYGNYTYEITDVQVKLNTDKTAYDLLADHENLIMYTCYPFDELGLTPYRCFVYAKPVSGPVIDKNG